VRIGERNVGTFSGKADTGARWSLADAPLGVKNIFLELEIFKED
jgi:hypothetical protein